MTRTNLTEFPPELLLRIFNFLTPRDWLLLKSVSRIFSVIADDHQLWQSYYGVNFNLSDPKASLSLKKMLFFPARETFIFNYDRMQLQYSTKNKDYLCKDAKEYLAQQISKIENRPIRADEIHISISKQLDVADNTRLSDFAEFGYTFHVKVTSEMDFEEEIESTGNSSYSPKCNLF